MRPPFVGRERELRVLGRHLGAGSSVVLTGAFGSGRTTLIAELARRLPSRRFVCWREGASMRVTLATARVIASATATHSAAPGPGVVIVVDDVAHVSAQRLRCFRDMTGLGWQVVAIIEQSMQPEEIVRLRAALGAARFVVLGSVSSGAAQRYFARALGALGLKWTEDEIRATATATHGHPLTMRMTLDAAISRWRPETLERPAGRVRLQEKKPSNGDGVRR